MFMLKNLGRLVTRPASPPRVFPTTGFRNVPRSDKLDEEGLKWYTPQMFYPVRIGETFQSRYQVITKLGFGSSATVWLARDLQDHKYVALKVCMSGYPSIAREKAAFTRLATVKHPSSYVQRCFDTFTTVGAAGNVHDCFVLEALTHDIYTYKLFRPGQQYDLALFRHVVRQIMEALKFLHTEAKLIHGDLRPENFLLHLASDEFFQKFEELETKHPSPRKIDGDRIIYGRSDYVPIPSNVLRPVLCDFGETRPGDSEGPHLDDIQPFPHRAPEVILCIPWSYSADVWNVGLMLWYLFEDKTLFDPYSPDGSESNTRHLAEMIAIMGPPPLNFLQRAMQPELNVKPCFDQSGKWKGHIPVPDMSLESLESRLEGEEKAEFLRFMRRILKWVPEERATASELCEDPWLARDDL